MKHPIRLAIMKKFVINSGFNRYYQIDKIMITNNSRLKTEAQLCYYLYIRHGEGRYWIRAYQKGHSGFWLYWIGFIKENGFIRDIRKNKEINRLKKEMKKTHDYEQREELEQSIDIEREISDIEKSSKKDEYVKGLIKSRAGQLNPYEEF